MGATYGLGQGITLLGNVHRGMGPAGASDTDVDPEISLNYVRSARLRRGGLYGEAIGFYSTTAIGADQVTADVCITTKRIYRPSSK